MGAVKGWINLTPELTLKGQRELQVGQILMFDYEGSKTNIRIMRKYKGKVWGKEVQLYKPEEVGIKEKSK